MFKAEDFDNLAEIKDICEQGCLCYVTRTDMKHGIHVYRFSSRQDTPENRAVLSQVMDAGQFLNDLFNEAPQEALVLGPPQEAAHERR
jgi:hypothetical protein